MKTKRFLRVLKYLGFLCLTGMLYAFFTDQTGLAIPCLIRLVTGFQCPGCGMTHLCVALLHLDFAAAFASNPAIFCLLPVFGVIFLKNTVQYIRTGRYKLSRMENIILAFSIVWLLLFGIVRNF